MPSPDPHCTVVYQPEDADPVARLHFTCPHGDSPASVSVANVLVYGDADSQQALTLAVHDTAASAAAGHSSVFGCRCFAPLRVLEESHA